MEPIRAGERQTQYQNHRIQCFKLVSHICCFLWLLGGWRAQASTNFSKLIAWGQSASASVSSPPGNSLPFINHCLDLGYEGMELDVLISKDNIPILSHGLYLPNGDIADPIGYTFEEIQQYSLGNWAGEAVRIPSLEAALRTNGNRGCILIMDMRVAAERVEAISNAVRQAEFNQATLAISAYDIASGQVFKQALPHARIYLKIYDYPENIPLSLVDQIETAGLDGLMLEESNDTAAVKDLTDHLHRKGLKLVLFVHYAANTLAELQNLVDADVDYILTVHHEMRDQINWPARVQQPPALQANFNATEQKLVLTWQLQLPYAYRVQTSTDGRHWDDLRVTMEPGPDTNQMHCTVPATATSGLFRLSYAP